MKEEISAYSSFEKAKCALRAKLNEIIATPNSMFSENGHIKMLNKYVENLPEDDKEFNKKFDGVFGSPECWKCEVPFNVVYNVKVRLNVIYI